MRFRLGILLLLAILATLGCSESRAGYPKISQRDLVAQLDRGDSPLLVDVRTRDEYVSGHIPGAVNVPLGELEARLPELDPGTDLVVYCERGGRAERAMLILEEAGYGQARQLEGDMRAWRAGRLPCQGC